MRRLTRQILMATLVMFVLAANAHLTCFEIALFDAKLLSQDQDRLDLLIIASFSCQHVLVKVRNVEVPHYEIGRCVCYSRPRN